jgi:APA family basic amino acid/polyamine antiporter
MIPGQAEFLGNMYAFGAMLSFTIAHLAVVALRTKAPDVERPYRGPGTITVAGRELPVFALLGGAGTGIAWLTVTALHLKVAAAGLGWLVFGVLLYVIYRRRQGLDLTTTTKVAVPKPVIEREAEYESILVALDEREYVPELVATAMRLAALRRRGVHLLVTITVPQTSPIDADLPQEERAAQAIIEQAKIQGGRRVSGHFEKVRAGGEGRLIVDEARELRARAIVLLLRRKAAGGGSALFSRTHETVLAERPCRVIIESFPADGARRGAYDARAEAA